MTREIKFRIPTRCQNGHFRWEYILIDFPEDGAIKHVWGEKQCECQTHGIDQGFSTIGSSQQDTGLKDKNGKEIYEGDIVKYMYLNTNPIEERTSEVKLMSIGDVNRNIQAYYPFCYSIAGAYKDEKREVTECFLTPSEECEIIGHVYENPELITS